ncbi:MAG TPA: hypothetical protein VFL63_02825 [Rhodanobacteraceae bacterium]|nr:hypothetical protein [Rhodanobacteraceae bacterium]
MPRTLILAAAVTVGLGFASLAQAQSAPATSTPATTTAARHHNAASETQRNVNQQTRIENGLDSGQLNTREAGKLERGQRRIDKTEQRAMRNGSLSASERARIQKQQNAESKAVYKQKHDAQTGNPNSKSSQRMQSDVQRNVNQQQRIHNGVDNGSLTHHEVARMEGGQARSDRHQANAAQNGRVGRYEQGHIQHGDNRDSRRIYRQKHDRQHRRGG